jgi:PAS domain S-box-containing protein
MSSGSEQLGELRRFNEQVKALEARLQGFLNNGLGLSKQQNVEELLSALEELNVAQEELQQQQEELLLARQTAETQALRYEELFEFAPDGYLVTDLNGIILEANLAAVALFNTKDVRSLIKKPLTVYIASASQVEMRSHISEVSEQKSTHTWDARVVPRHKPEVDVMFTLAPGRPGFRQAERFYWQVRDITERKQDEEAVRKASAALEHRVQLRTQNLEEALAREKEARTQAERLVHHLALVQEIASGLSGALTLEQIGEAFTSRTLTMVDATAGLLAKQPAHGDKFELFHSIGYTPEQLNQKLLIDAPRLLAEAVRTKTPVWVDSEDVARQRYPHLKIIDQEAGAWAALPMIVDNEVIGGVGLSFPKGYILTAEDKLSLLVVAQHCAQAVSRALLYEAEKQARAKAEEANMVKMRFLAMISHELRTPLTSIMGFASTLLATDVQWTADNVNIFMQIIFDESVKLKELIDQLLDESRLESGTLHVDLTALRFHDILDRVLPQLRLFTIEHTFKINMPTELPLMMADSRRVEQVLLNLVQNAVKYSPLHTEITLRVAVNQPYLQVDVADQGYGIPPELRDSVFQPFFQGELPMRAQRSGTGLGLAICKGVVQAHGGRIWVQERDNGSAGTTISFTLPIVVLEGAPNFSSTRPDHWADTLEQ